MEHHSYPLPYSSSSSSSSLSSPSSQSTINHMSSLSLLDFSTNTTIESCSVSVVTHTLNPNANSMDKKKRKPQLKSKDKKSEKKQKKVEENGYIHVRARRGQATDSHSLAERVRRERISERMKLLQALVPGCDKVTGKALMLDEIINYVQSLQNQVEFLSMKLASVNPMFYDFGLDLEFSTHQDLSNCEFLENPLLLPECAFNTSLYSFP